jgi:hypothetical protein
MESTTFGEGDTVPGIFSVELNPDTLDSDEKYPNRPETGDHAGHTEN